MRSLFLDKLLYSICIGGLGIYFIYVVAIFFLSADAYPIVTTDDGLAAVSYVLSEHGRYGFLASPLQAPTQFLRHDGFFNYGPSYFVLGAALSSIFGFSLGLMRSITFLAYGFLIAIGFFFFRRYQIGSSKLNMIPWLFWSFIMLFCLEWRQIIIARPDIIVGTLGLMAIMSATQAMSHKDKSLWWILTGFLASSSAFSHLFAWAIIPAVVCCVCLDLALRYFYGKEDFKSLRWPFLVNIYYLFIGGCMGLFLFIWSFNFRLRDFFGYIQAYQASYFEQTTYIQAIVLHLENAFAFLKLPNVFMLSLVLIFSSLGLIIFFLKKPDKSGQFILPTLIPALVSFLTIVLFLGMHKWTSGYYSVIIQFLGFWLGAVFLWGMLVLLLKYLPAQFLKQTYRSAYLVFVVLVVARMAIAFQGSHPRMVEASLATPYKQYFYEVLRGIPRGASAWGTVMFGIESPDRLQLIQFSEALGLAKQIPLRERYKVKPDYIVWGLNEERDAQVSLFSNEQLSRIPLAHMKNLFPETNYSLVKIVDAPPYRMTRIYKDTGGTSKDDTGEWPDMALYDVDDQSWITKAQKTLQLEFTDVEPVNIYFGYERRDLGVFAQKSWKTEASPGVYFIKVRFIESEETSVVCLSSAEKIVEVTSYLPASFDCSFEMNNGGSWHYLILRHNGGPLYISLFQNTKLVSHFDVQVRKALWRRPEPEPMREFYTDKIISIFHSFLNER